jgi:DNA-nicking Smr family endonuclease
LGGKRKMPDDMDLFRREVGDVRPLKVNNRVLPQPPRDARKPGAKSKNTPVSEGQDAPDKAQCLRTPGKTMYETMRDAARAAEFVMLEWREAVRPYKCDSCGKFHLTSKS